MASVPPLLLPGREAGALAGGVPSGSGALGNHLVSLYGQTDSDNYGVKEVMMCVQMRDHVSVVRWFSIRVNGRPH